MNKILTIEPLIDRDQLALILGVNPQTISLMRRRKEFLPIRSVHRFFLIAFLMFSQP
jgi:hypothetical protein